MGMLSKNYLMAVSVHRACWPAIKLSIISTGKEHERTRGEGVLVRAF